MNFILHVSFRRTRSLCVFPPDSRFIVTVEFHLPLPRRVFTWEISAEYEEKFFYCVGARALEQLPKEVVESPSLEMFKTHQDMILCNLSWMNLLEQEGRMSCSLEIPFHTSYSMSLGFWDFTKVTYLG